MNKFDVYLCIQAVHRRCVEALSHVGLPAIVCEVYPVIHKLTFPISIVPNVGRMCRNYRTSTLWAVGATCGHPGLLQTNITTRSQAVARVADRTASQHLRGSRDVIGNVTI